MYLGIGSPIPEICNLPGQTGEGISAAFSYSKSSFRQDESDPTPTITGTQGGTFTSTPSGLSINSSTGTIDLSVSAIKSYTITYTVQGISAQQSLSVISPITIDNNFSMEFDGTSYIVASSNQSLGITNSISISTWVKFPLNYDGGGNPRRGYIISENNLGAPLMNFSLYFQGRSPSISFLFYNTDGTQNLLNVPNADLNNNQWHHIVATYDGTTNTNGINVYIDTVKTSATALSTGMRSTSNVGTLIGATRESNARDKVQGNLDELAVWNGSVISESTVQDIYNATANNSGKVYDLNQVTEGAPTVWYRMGD